LPVNLCYNHLSLQFIAIHANTLTVRHVTQWSGALAHSAAMSVPPE